MLYIGLLYPISACLPLAQASQSVYTDGTVDFGPLVASHVSGIKNDGRAWFFPICGPPAVRWRWPSRMRPPRAELELFVKVQTPF